MPRTIMRVKRVCNLGEAERRAAEILTKNGYHEVEQGGELIWTKGDVKLTGVRAVKLEYGQDDVKISGWIRGLVGGETSLEGFASIATKRPVKKVMEELQVAFLRS